jgi:hypothetical protein
MRMLYEIVGADVPVVMSDLDAIWFKDALRDIEVCRWYVMHAVSCCTQKS